MAGAATCSASRSRSRTCCGGSRQPFAGAIADRFGTVRVLCVGAILYALGLALMAYSQYARHAPSVGRRADRFRARRAARSTSCSRRFGKLVPESWRSLSFGAGTAAGSFGQFLFSPLSVCLQDAFGWQSALLIFAGLTLLVLPLSLALATPRAGGAGRRSPWRPSRNRRARRSARRSRHRSLHSAGARLLHLRLPARLHHRAHAGLSRRPRPVGRKSAAGPSRVIGLFNIIGSLGSGWLGTRMPKRYILSAIYFIRALAVLVFIAVPGDAGERAHLRRGDRPAVAVDRAADHGLVVVMFGTRWLAMLFGRRLLQPPGRRLPRRVARRHRLRAHRLLRRRVVAVDPVRRAVGADQSADRREAGDAAWRWRAPDTALRDALVRPPARRLTLASPRGPPAPHSRGNRVAHSRRSSSARATAGRPRRSPISTRAN